jgi:protein-L-isoaspartate(D-aspartate) O-methyltransferase
MVDYAAARFNMVESQIRPNKVTDPRVLRAISEVPRERFVPKKLMGIAYVDEDLAVAPGRYLMEPMAFARLLQDAAIQPGDIVLDIGCATGYSTAVLAKLAATVVAVESDPQLVERASTVLAELNVDNAVVVAGALEEGYAEQAPYDVILLGGAVEEVPRSITDQLGEGGRLMAVVTGGSRVGKGNLIHRVHGDLSGRVLFDAAVPPLPGFAVERGFVF